MRAEIKAEGLSENSRRSELSAALILRYSIESPALIRATARRGAISVVFVFIWGKFFSGSIFVSGLRSNAIFSAIISTALIALFSFVLMVLFGVGAGLWLHKWGSHKLRSRSRCVQQPLRHLPFKLSAAFLNALRGVWAVCS
jgi:ABC-type phosphate transport system permease subunit